ncbi:MAG: NAD(P)-binding domain-containing protein [Candidatus Solibacter sp.]
MARNLLRAGYEVVVRSNTAAKAQELAAAEKGKFCTTPRQVAEYAAGMGLQVKLTQNLILSNLLMAFNEGMVLATKGGVDRPRTHAGDSRQQRGQERAHQLQGSIRPGAELYHQL